MPIEVGPNIWRFYAKSLALAQSVSRPPTLLYIIGLLRTEKVHANAIIIESHEITRTLGRIGTSYQQPNAPKTETDPKSVGFSDFQTALKTARKCHRSPFFQKESVWVWAKDIDLRVPDPRYASALEMMRW